MTQITASSAVQRLLERFDHARLGPFHFRLILIAGINWIWAALGVTIIGYVLPAIKQTWAVSDPQLGLIASSGMAGMMVGSVLAGILADRIGRRKTLELTMVSIGVFSSASALAWSYPALLFFRLLTGIGLGAVLPVASTLVSEYSPARYRGRLLVLLNGFWGLGGGVAAVIGYWLVPGTGWRLPLLFVSLAALSAPLIHRFLPESMRFWIGQGNVRRAEEVALQIQAANGGLEFDEPGILAGNGEETSGRSNVAAGPAQVVTPWSRGYLQTTLSLWLLWFALNFTFQGVFVWLPSLLLASGRTEQEAFVYMLIISMGQIPGTLIAAVLADVIRRRLSLLSFVLCWCAATFLFGFAASPAAILTLGVLIGVGNGAAWGMAYPFTTELYPTRIRGAATGWATGIGRVGGMAAPLLVGLLLQMGVGNAWIFALLAGVPSLSVLGLLGLKRETTGRALEEIESRQ